MVVVYSKSFNKRGSHNDGSEILATQNHTKKVFERIFKKIRKLFVHFVLSKYFREIGRAETIRLVQKSSNFELSSRFFGRLKTETKPVSYTHLTLPTIITV